MTAPTVYIALEWPNLRDQPSVIIQCHFNALANDIPGIDDFVVERKTNANGNAVDEAVFIAGGVAVEGFNQPELRHSSTLKQLRRLLEDDTRLKHMRLQFGQLLSVHSPFRALLPYVAQGSIYRLSSLTSGQWSQLLPPKPERDLSELIYGPNPLPMVSYECHDTYTTVNEAIVELYESARMAHLEQEVALEEWASVPHNGTLYRIGGAMVMAVRFAPTRPLGGPAGIVKIDLPERLRVSMTWDDPMTGEALCASGSRTVVPLRLPIGYDALFIISNKRNIEEHERLREACLGRNDTDRRFAAQVKFVATIPRGTLYNQLMTAMNLEQAHSWHEIILNQRHDQLTRVDLATSRLGPAIITDLNTSQPDSTSVMPDLAEEAVTVGVEQALEWMLNWRNWNPEQLQALHSIRQAVGRIVLITGPAGTGKTLILQAICVFFYLMDMHVLVLAPANSNCADFMRKLVQLFPKDTTVCGKEVLATRVFPPSADFSPEKEAKAHHGTSRPASNETDRGAASARLDVPASSVPEPSPATDSGFADVFDLEMIRSELHSSSDKYSQFKDFGLAQQVLNAAHKGEKTLIEQLGREQPVDVWQVLRQCLDDAQAGTFDWNNKLAVQKYQQSYDACKAHFMSKQRLVVTTTGNVRCDDIVNNFASNKHGVECKGMIVILDEACKDREIDSLSAILHPDWRAKITGMIMLGDERQLEPTNTCAKGRVQFNPFSERLNIPLLSRLKREGFPCVELVEQHRMSHHISSWPSKNFYGSGMRDGEGTKGTLADKQPGLFACLKSILIGAGSTSFGAPSSEAKEDKSIRTHYLELRGTRDNSKKSAFVQEHVHVFFDRIYWKLRAYYGEKMEEQCMIIVAYKGAMDIWHEAMAHLQRKYNIPTAQMPRILTIDSSQGAEASVCMIDCSVQEYSSESRRKDIGFCDDDKRMNVAMTRAQEVRWFLGGSCSVSQRAPGQADTPAYVRFKEEAANNEVTVVDNCLLPRDDLGWLDSLRKQEIQLGLRFSDEVKVEV